MFFPLAVLQVYFCAKLNFSWWKSKVGSRKCQEIPEVSYFSIIAKCESLSAVESGIFKQSDRFDSLVVFGSGYSVELFDCCYNRYIDFILFTVMKFTVIRSPSFACNQHTRNFAVEQERQKSSFYML